MLCSEHSGQLLPLHLPVGCGNQFKHVQAMARALDLCPDDVDLQSQLGSLGEQLTKEEVEQVCLSVCPLMGAQP